VKRARFIAAARLEFLAEVIYHNEAQPGLGERFSAAVEDAAARALAYPLSGSSSRGNTRRIIVKGFRFTIVYRPEPDGIVIFAVAHHSRRPFYWQSRARARRKLPGKVRTVTA
jgi:toxin ParE1/3/4